MKRTLIGLALAIPLASAHAGPTEVCLNLAEPKTYSLPSETDQLQHPLLFVTQMPLGADMENRMSAFGHHQGTTEAAGRGGDLYILHPPGPQAPAGCLRNLTRESGFGEAGIFQGESAIAVREPTIHPDGNRALFSMVDGAPGPGDNPAQAYYWQIYEIVGLGLEDVPVIRHIEEQPADYNNVSPAYAPDGGILFTSDLPIGGPANRHLYPPRDEYELMPTTLGLWWLDPAAGADSLRLLTHNPSGAFTPLVDSFGRVLFVSWDHLQRDIFQFGLNGRYSWNLSDESPDAVLTDNREHFPDPQDAIDPDTDAWPQYGTANEHDIKLFFLWQLTATELPSGEVVPYTDLEIINHLGRHQLAFYFEPNYLEEANGLEYFTHPEGRDGSLDDGILFPVEDPNVAGRYWFTDGQHFTKNSSGPLLYLDAPPGRSPDDILPVRVTSEQDGSGAWRDPLPLSNGKIIGVHTPTTAATEDDGQVIDDDHFLSLPNYRFTLRLLSEPDQDGLRQPGPAILPELNRHIEVRGIHPGRTTVYDGPMSQLDPVEVVARPMPDWQTHALPAPERTVFEARDLAPEELVSYMRERDLALIVVRDAITRDDADRQQPFNLFVQDNPAHVADTGQGRLYPVQYLEIFQGDMLRVSTYAGVDNGSAPDTPPEDYDPGRRVLAVAQHDAVDFNLPFQTSDATAVALDAEFRRAARKLAPDGSVAAFVPAGRALSWQLTDADGAPIVRERYWLTLQPGEIRVCSSCHGIDTHDQLGRPAPTNPPEALDDLLEYWSSTLRGMLFSDNFEE